MKRFILKRPNKLSLATMPKMSYFSRRDKISLELSKKLRKERKS